MKKQTTQIYDIAYIESVLNAYRQNVEEITARYDLLMGKVVMIANRLYHLRPELLPQHYQIDIMPLLDRRINELLASYEIDIRPIEILITIDFENRTLWYVDLCIDKKNRYKVYQYLLEVEISKDNTITNISLANGNKTICYIPEIVTSLTAVLSIKDKIIESVINKAYEIIASKDEIADKLKTEIDGIAKMANLVNIEK